MQNFLREATMNWNPGMILVDLAIIGLVSVSILSNYLLYALYHRLEDKHPKKYKELGEPSLIWNDSLKNSTDAFFFVIGREHASMGDRTLSLISDGIIALFPAAIAFFALLLWGLHLAAH